MTTQRVQLGDYPIRDGRARTKAIAAHQEEQFLLQRIDIRCRALALGGFAPHFPVPESGCEYRPSKPRANRLIKDVRPPDDPAATASSRAPSRKRSRISPRA